MLQIIISGRIRLFKPACPCLKKELPVRVEGESGNKCTLTKGYKIKNLKSCEKVKTVFHHSRLCQMYYFVTPLASSFPLLYKCGISPNEIAKYLVYFSLDLLL